MNINDISTEQSAEMEFKSMEDLSSVSTGQKTTMTNLAYAFNESQEADADPGAMKKMVAVAKVYGVEKDAIKEAETKIKRRKADLRAKELILFDMFQAVGITSIKAEGRTYFTRIDTYASVDAARKDTALEWIDEVGWDYLIAKTVNARSLTREIKTYIEETGEVPGEDQGIKLRTENRVCAPKG